MHRSRMAATVSALACAACSVCSAQNTQVLFEASRDAGLTWAERVNALPGDDMLVQVRIRLINVSATLVSGLGGITFQPRLTNWNPAFDTRLPFSTPDGSAVPRAQPDALGRIAPFASSGMGTTSQCGLLTSFVDAGNTLRFAGANAVTSTTNLAWGVSSAQVPPSIGGTNFRSETDIAIFRYGVRLEGETPRDLLATVNLSDIVGQRGSWYRNTPFDLVLAPVRAEDILPATIHYIPTPATMLALLGAIAAPRRTRRITP